MCTSAWLTDGVDTRSSNAEYPPIFPIVYVPKARINRELLAEIGEEERVRLFAVATRILLRQDGRRRIKYTKSYL